MTQPAAPRVIKRYANRKLYDTSASRYVTLDQIADMIRAGDDVKVIDNNSKEDLTNFTLAQIIFDEEKKQKQFLPLAAMRSIIQTGGESIQHLVVGAGDKVRAVFRRDRPEEEEAPPEQPAAPASSAANDARAIAASPSKMRDLLESGQRSLEEFQRRIDERIRHAMEQLSPLSGLQRELTSLHGRIEQIEKRIKKLTERTSESNGNRGG